MISNDTITKYWEHEDLKDLYIALIGQDYGKNPIEQLEKIEQNKIKSAQIIIDEAKIKKTDIGLEIGSGTGFITKPIAKISKHLFACDISETYLKAARQYCKELDNVSFHKMTPGELPILTESKIDFAYANNVFIHLTFYEIINYLTKLKEKLRIGGVFWFDFVEIERLNILTDLDFKDTMDALAHDPLERRCIQFNSSEAITNAIHLLNFEIIKTWKHHRCNTSMAIKLLC